MYQQVGRCLQQIKTKMHLQQLIPCPTMDLIKCCIGRTLVLKLLLWCHQKCQISTVTPNRPLLTLVVCRLGAVTPPVGIRGRSAWSWRSNRRRDAPALEAICTLIQIQKSWWSGWRVLRITSHSPSVKNFLRFFINV